MNEGTLAIVSIVVLLVILIVGFGLGYFFSQKNCVVGPNACPPTLMDLKMLQTWSVFAKGEVKEISDQYLTLTSSGETLEIFVPDGIQIESLTNQGVKKMSFQDIKTGSKLEIKLMIPQEKTPLIATLITILP